MEENERKRVIDLVKKSVHSRYRPNFGGYITFYGKNNESPTGVISIGGCPATEEYQNLIRETDPRISSLSPTEGLMSGNGNNNGF